MRSIICVCVRVLDVIMARAYRLEVVNTRMLSLILTKVYRLEVVYARGYVDYLLS